MVSQAVEATAAWCDGRIADEAWLAAIRALYGVGLAPGGWRVGTHFHRAIAALGESATSIAWVNGARCQWAGRAPRGIVRPCLGRFPFTGVLDILRPRLVLTTEFGVAQQVQGAGFSVLHFHQLNGLSWTGTHVAGNGELVAIPPGKRTAEWVLDLVNAGFVRAHA